MNMLSYNNDPELKKKFVKEVKWHKDQDNLLQGAYAKDGKYCAVGCAIESLNKLNGKHYDHSDHSVYEKELGVPEWLARLEDTLFEGITKEESKDWPLSFARAIPVGVDLEPVRWKLNVFIQKRNLKRVKALDIDESLKRQVCEAIQQVIELNKTAIQLGLWNESAAESARSAAESAAWSARSAARSAAESAAESAAWSARSAAESAAWSAWSAAESARSAAESAAWSAAESAAWSAAWSAAEYTALAKETLRLLRAEAKL